MKVVLLNLLGSLNQNQKLKSIDLVSESLIYGLGKLKIASGMGTSTAIWSWKNVVRNECILLEGRDLRLSKYLFVIFGSRIYFQARSTNQRERTGCLRCLLNTFVCMCIHDTRTSNEAALYYLRHGVGVVPRSLRREEPWACASSLCAHLAHGRFYMQLPCSEAPLSVRPREKAGLGAWTVFPNCEFDGCA